jgi:hypothetical protein
LQLWLGQTCGVTQNDAGEYRLFTNEYTYTLTAEGNTEPLLRWEYKKTRPRNTNTMWCRHHLQGPVELNIAEQAVRLNDLHLPTGYVPLEEIIRFCIVDLRSSR